MAVPSFGAVPLAAVRVAGAALLLLPMVLMLRRGSWAELKRHAPAIIVVGVLGSALPFLMYGIAAQALNAGVMSIINATTPMWGAMIAWLWLGDTLRGARVLGLALGFAGVAWLAWDHAGVKSDSATLSPLLATAACLVATLGYGYVAAFTKKKLVGVTPMVVAAGSQAAGAVVLAMPAIWNWPQQVPPASAWWSALALAILCTGIAYLLYFRLIAHVGAAHATTVTFLIPLFAVLWGSTLLGEPITAAMVVACGLILLGTGLSTGVLRRALARGRVDGPSAHIPASGRAALRPSPNNLVPLAPAVGDNAGSPTTIDEGIDMIDKKQLGRLAALMGAAALIGCAGNNPFQRSSDSAAAPAPSSAPGSRSQAGGAPPRPAWMNAAGEVTDSKAVEAGYGEKVKGLDGWEGEITGKPAPGTKFTQVQIGMSRAQVQSIVGAPTDQGAYITGKAWIPWYFGSDRYRHEFAYKGMGRLIFAGSGGFDTNAHLVWIIHNKNDSGFR